MNAARPEKWLSIVLFVSIAALSASSASAATQSDTSGVQFGDLLAQLTGLFVVATIMESALALIFQWRLYREFFDGRAVKTVVMVAVGFAVVTQFNYDIFDRIVRLAGGDGGDPALSKFLSALVLAGGSAAVFELFKALGLRAPVDPDQDKPKPPSDRAWVSVRIIRKEAIGDIKVHIVEFDPPVPAVGLLPTQLAGVIGHQRTVFARLKGVFFADPLRLPPYGGLSVRLDKDYLVYAEAIPASDQEVAPKPVSREIYRGRFAGRAVIDLVYTF